MSNPLDVVLRLIAALVLIAIAPFSDELREILFAIFDPTAI